MRDSISAMWELICHHTYKWGGRPVDISRYDNPAVATNRVFVADGIAPGSGALRFVNRAASVRVDSHGPAWDPLGAIKVELTAKMTDPSSGRQMLIEADNSFGVFVDDDAGSDSSAGAGAFFCVLSTSKA
jgi:hypothetical protein